MKKLLMLLTLFISLSVGATTYNPTSIAQANSYTLQPGDIVTFARGVVYNDAQLNVNYSGTAQNPITYTTRGTGNAPIISKAGDQAMQIYHKNYIVIDGLNFTDPTMDPNNHTLQSNVDLGINIDGSNYITIQNCTFSLVGAGINIVGDYNTVKNCTMTNLRMIRNTPTNVNSDDDYGANPVVIGGANNNILGNIFKDCWAVSYDYGFDGGAVEIYGGGTNNNIIMYNIADNCNGFLEFGSGNGGTSANNYFAYNRITNCDGLVYINNSGQYTLNVTNLQFYNNSIAYTGTTMLGGEWFIAKANSAGSAGQIVLKNNVFWAAEGIDIVQSSRFGTGQVVHENNVYKLGPGSVLGFTIGGSEKTTDATVWTNVSSPNPSQWDMNVPLSSAAYRAGQTLGIQLDIVGHAVATVPSAGAYEFIGTVLNIPLPTPTPQPTPPTTYQFYTYSTQNYIITLNARKRGWFYITNNSGVKVLKGTYKVGTTNISMAGATPGVYYFKGQYNGPYKIIR